MKFIEPLPHYRRSFFKETELGYAILWADTCIAFSQSEEQALRIVERLAELLAVIEAEESEAFTSG